MRVDAFDFDLPRERIADRPAVPRDAARLLHVAADGLADRIVRDLPGLVRPGDVVVVNDSRVIPARLHGMRQRPGVDPLKIEILLHKAEGGPRWRAFARPGKRLKPGDVLDFGGGLGAEIADKSADGDVGLIFDRDGAALIAALEAQGEMPLPPYIPRPNGADARDRSDYQTVYANDEGSVAAPTAGLHFTPELIAAIAASGATLRKVTLHVGAGTFLPVKAEDTADHRMHSEWGTVSPEVADAINAARANGGRLLAVGTTATRILETATGADGIVHPFSGDTAIFITPGYRFRAVDRLLTNFHLPKSTLFMLVSAFAGLERMQAAYAHAIAKGYRFYSYGDASLLEGNPQ